MPHLKTLFLQLAVLMAILLLPCQVFPQSLQWQMTRTFDSEDSKIKVWRSKEKQQGIVSVKAELVVNSTLSGFLLFLQDTDNIPLWLDNAKSSQILKQFTENKNLFVTYFDKQWPVSARHMIIQTEYRQNYDGSIDIYVMDAVEFDNELIEASESIRVSVNHAHWFIKAISPSQIKITYQFSVNPNGNIPNWVANNVTISSVFRTMKNLSQQLPQSQWQKHTLTNIKEYSAFNSN